MKMRFLIVFLLGGVSGICQPFTAGVKVGVPLNDLVNATKSQNFNFVSQTNRYIFGVTGEIHLPFGLGIEVDALYRHLNYSGSRNLVDLTQNISTTANAWEFPILAKYRFSGEGPVRPFVDGGLAWDTLQGVKQVITTGNLSTGTGATTSTSNPAELNDRTSRGIVLGGGLDLHALFIHVLPEVRYTRWGARHFLDPNGGIHSNQNQAEFLLGITF